LKFHFLKVAKRSEALESVLETVAMIARNAVRTEFNKDVRIGSAFEIRAA
jgi:hypothetical protein